MLVYQIVKGDSRWPHGGGLQVTKAGTITISDTNGTSDENFDDYSDHWGPVNEPIDGEDQIVQKSSVDDIIVGDRVDSRYSHLITSSDDGNFSAEIYFLATNQDDNYGIYFVSNKFLDPEVVYYFDGYTQRGLVKYSDLIAPCFAKGTLISTINGDVVVEKLLVGDEVRTLDNGYKKILWLGNKKLCDSSLKSKPKLLPIRIKKGALGGGLPLCDLIVSPQHRIFVRSKVSERMFGKDEILIPAKYLVELNGVDVISKCREIEYFHILFDQHEIIYSNGAPTESLLYGPQLGDIISQRSKMEIINLYPNLFNHELVQDKSRFEPEKGRFCRNFVERHKKNNRPLLDNFFAVEQAT